jgi:hypothetical protein
MNEILHYYSGHISCLHTCGCFISAASKWTARLFPNGENQEDRKEYSLYFRIVGGIISGDFNCENHHLSSENLVRKAGKQIVPAGNIFIPVNLAEIIRHCL